MKILFLLFAPIDVFLEHPLLALLPTFAFFAVYAVLRAGGRRRGLGWVLTAAVVWAAYAAYESHMGPLGTDGDRADTGRPPPRRPPPLAPDRLRHLGLLARRGAGPGAVAGYPEQQRRAPLPVHPFDSAADARFLPTAGEVGRWRAFLAENGGAVRLI